MEKMTDESLVELLQTEPQKGYVVLTNQYLGYVYTIAYDKLSKVCSKEDIEEFIMDIFYEFYCNRNQINLEKGSIKAFLSVFTKRKAINLYHKKSKEYFAYSLYDDDIEHILAEKENVLQNIVDSETKRELLDVVKALGKPDSEIIIRKFYFGQTMKEIGLEIGIKPRTAQKRYERALEKLKVQMGGIENGAIYKKYI